MLRLLDFLFSIVGRVLVWLIRQLARLIAWLAVQAVMHPRSTGAAGMAAASVAFLGWQRDTPTCVGRTLRDLRFHMFTCTSPRSY
jgi:hypothetical protein